MITVTIQQARTRLSRLIAAAEAGEEVVITRGRTPVARLTAMVPATPAMRRPGRLKGQILVDDDALSPLPEDELQLWEGTGDRG